MKHYLDLVSISNKVHRRQSRMTRICIVLAVFLVAVMFGLADMYLQSMTDEIRHQKGDWHCKFTSISTETAEYIQARPEIDVSGWQGTISTESGYSLKGQALSLSGMDEEVFSQVYLGSFLSGKFPETIGDAALSSALAQATGLSVGDFVSLDCPDGDTVQLTITGIFDDEVANLTTGNAYTLLLVPDGLSTITAGNLSDNWQYVVRFSLVSNVSSSIADIQQQNDISNTQIAQNLELLSLLGQADDSTVSAIYTIAFLLAIVVMGTCIMMISSSLTNNVSQRMEFFGLMRCLGATKRQVLRFVRREALQWCITAMPIGIAASIVVIWGLCAVMRQLSTVWFGYMPVFGISWLSIGISVVLGLITVLLAARSPAKMAAKVSPLEAVTGNTQQESSFRHAANTRRWNVEVALGIHHAKAKRRSYLLMTGAFAICIALFLGFCTLVPFMENAFMPKEWAPDLSIVSKTNTCSIPSDRMDVVAQNQAVKRVFGRMFAYDVPAEMGGAIHNSNLISYEENQFRWAQDQLTAGSIETVRNTPGQVLFVANTGTEVQIGDTITLTINGQDQIVTVGGILSDSPLARAEDTETLICSEETFSQLTGETGYTILDVQFRFGADEEDVAEIEALFGEGVTFTDTLIKAQQQRGLYYAFATLIYGFLSIIVAITIFHIMNTISMGVSARTRQYGVMRAIGMSNQQLTRMISAEAASYAISGVIVGCVFGLLFHWFLYSSLITRTFGKPWGVPWLELCLIVGVILATTALAVRGPAKRLHAMSIVENISSQ